MDIKQIILDIKQAKKEKYYYIVLGLLVVSNTILFSVAALSSHHTLNTFGFDLGIQHQATWLISRFENPFVTVCGLHFFGIHARFISILTAPFLWIWQDARMMLLLQSVALSLAAIPLFLIAKEKLGNGLIAIAIVISFLLFPALGHLNMENFHYDTFLVLFISCAFYFLIIKNYAFYFTFIVLALLTKEEVAASILLLGIYACFQDKRIGIITIVMTVLYVAFILNIVFPAFNPEGYAYYSRLKIGEVFLSDPLKLETYKEMIEIFNKNMFTERNGDYLLQLFYPVAFVPLLSPVTLLLAGSLYINLLSEWGYAHSIKYHYVASIIPFIFISVIYALSYLTEGKARKILVVLVIAILTTSVIGNSTHGARKTRLKNLDGFPQLVKDVMNPQEKLEAMMKMIPKEATITATYNVLPHLTDRVTAFQFPNPFKRSYWALSGKAAYTEVKYVDYVILDTRRDKDYEEFEKLKSDGTYVIEKSDGPFILYKYVEPEK